MENNISERIKRAIEGKGISYQALQEKSGIPKSAIQRYASGDTEKLPIDRVVKIAKALSVSPGYLMGWEDDAKEKTTGVRIPVLGSVIAGIPIEAIEEIIDYEEISEQLAKTGEFFALRIKGDSMEPRMYDGDVVIVRKQEEVDSGDVAIILVNGDEATVKRVKIDDNGIMMIPFNPKYTPWFYTAEECESLPVRILGKVVECRQKY